VGALGGTLKLATDRVFYNVMLNFEIFSDERDRIASLESLCKNRGRHRAASDHGSSECNSRIHLHRGGRAQRHVCAREWKQFDRNTCIISLHSPQVSTKKLFTRHLPSKGYVQKLI